MHGELEAVRAEGIGLDPVGAGLDVLGVDALNDLGIVEVEDVEAGVERHAPGIEHGAHRAVAEKRPLAQALEEGRGHLQQVVTQESHAEGIGPPHHGLAHVAHAYHPQHALVQRAARQLVPHPALHLVVELG